MGTCKRYPVGVGVGTWFKVTCGGRGGYLV